MVGRNHMIVNSTTCLGLGVSTYALAMAPNPVQNIASKIWDFFVPVQPVWQIVLWLATGFLLMLFGSLLPDIDSKKSILGRYVHLPVTHRTITHTAWVVILLFLMSWKLRLFAWMTLGYTLHIFYDGLSTAGIAWFWPISRYIRYPNGASVKKGFRFKFYRTGEGSETMVVIIASAIWLFLGLMCVLRLFFGIE